MYIIIEIKYRYIGIYRSVKGKFGLKMQVLLSYDNKLKTNVCPSKACKPFN